MLRILIITNYYPPDMVGGYEKACADTVAYLARQGHRVHILSRAWISDTSGDTSANTSGDTSRAASDTVSDGAYADELSGVSLQRELLTIDYQRPRYRQKWAVERQNYACTAQAIQAFQPQVIYLWSQRGISLAPVYAAEDSGVPCVFEIGDIWPDSYFKTGWKAALRRRIKAALPFLQQRVLHMPHVISVSQWMAEELSTRYRVGELSVIPNGTPLPPDSGTCAPFANAVSEPVLRPVSRYGIERALFVGRLDPEKGVLEALQALALLRQQGYRVSLDIAGTGDAQYLARCQQFVQAQALGEHVRFLGWQDAATLYPCYQLLLMPTSMREPFGLVVIEAMMHGLNVIAPAAYGPAEIITPAQTGWLFSTSASVPPAAAVARVWKQLIQDPLQAERVGQQAAAHARVHYALDRVKAQVLQVLQQTAQKVEV